MALRLKTRSQDDTFALGRALGAFLRPGDSLLLSGDLGTGKSVLARGAARSLGVEGPMPSPSFTIMFPYEGRVPVYHFDLYRLSGPDEFEAALSDPELRERFQMLGEDYRRMEPPVALPLSTFCCRMSVMAAEVSSEITCRR